MRLAVSILIALLLLAPLAPMARAEDEPDCDNAMDQNTMTQCAGLDFEKADRELNAIWPGLKAEAAEMDKELSDDLKGYGDALLASQRAWLTYRDTECVRQGFESRGGSMEPMIVSGCMAEMTRKRIKELTLEEGAQ